jgi:hypothetical protein
LPIRRIPEQYRHGFAKIKGLSLTDANAIAAALEKSPTTGGLRGMLSTVAEQVSALKREEAEDIVATLYSLYVYRADADTSLDGFVSELISAMRASGDGALIVSEQEENEFRQKIGRLLSVSRSAVISKAEQLQSDYAKTFYDAKILTDIRPIFAKPEEIPVGAVVTHTLKIEYHEDGEHKAVYLALDAADLQQMKKVLQRADSKVSSLRLLLKNAGLPDMSGGEV